MKSSLIIVAAGRGLRFGQSKALVRLAGKTLLEWNLELARSLDFLDETIVVVSPKDRDVISSLLRDLPCRLVDGGDHRSDSVKAGVEASSGDLVFIHNIANPFASTNDFRVLFESLQKGKTAVFVGQPVVDTLRRLSQTGSQTIKRDFLWRVQTPQGFYRLDLLKQLSDQPQATDEISLFENITYPIKAFPTSPRNVKITFPEDLEMAEEMVHQDVLFGIGEDSHSFESNGSLVLSGVTIDDCPKLRGNSDADVVLHAIFNAISSALGKGSIGPTADPMCSSGITDSSEYLRVILKEMKEREYRVSNLSIGLECARPKIEPLVPRFKEKLSNLLDLDELHIGITATTGDGLSSFGRGEGIKCLVGVVLSHHIPS